MSKTLKNIVDAVELFAQGKFLIVIDDENRENEGDLIISGEKITDQDMAFMIRHTSGIICSATSAKRAKELNLPIMVRENEDQRRTAFTISIDAKEGLTTGISATERANTVRKMASSQSRAADFIRPGHVFPLIAHPDGLAGRRGHTEAGLALCQLANQGESGVLSELVNDDGTVMKGQQLFDYASKYEIPVITIEDLALYALENLATNESQSQEIQWAQLPHETGHGYIIYLRGQEGRGIGLSEKIKAYLLQDQGLDTISANIELGHESDVRDWQDLITVLDQLKIKDIELITNNQLKVDAIEKSGRSVRVIAVPPSINEFNRSYLLTKKDKMKHMLGEI